MILFLDDEHVESALKKKVDNITLYLIHHGNSKDRVFDSNMIRIQYVQKIKRVTEITLDDTEGISTGVCIAKMIYAEQHFCQRREKIVFEFGNDLNDEISCILFPDKPLKKHANHYSDAFKRKMVNRWVEQKRPQIAPFARRYGINPKTFSEWVKKWNMENVIIPCILHVNKDDLSYYESEGVSIPYYYSIDFHEQLYETIVNHGIFLEPEEICAIENIVLSFGRKKISEDNCIYEERSHKQFMEYMQKYAISERIKDILPPPVISDIWQLREWVLEQTEVKKEK